MKVLLAETDIFSTIGGGQRFFSDLIRTNPDIDFYYFNSGNIDDLALPRNALPIPITDVYRRNTGQFAATDALPEHASWLDAKRHDLCFLLDMAASVASLSFDLLDIPDYLPFAAFLPACMRFHQVRIGKVSLSMHGVLSGALTDNWDGKLTGFETLLDYEQLLYRYADIRYGIGSRYLAAWSRQCQLPALLIDPPRSGVTAGAGRPVSALSGATPAQAGSRPAPDLCFVGRQEKFKGPDLFVALCSNLPKQAYGAIRLIGPGISLNGHSSDAALDTLAANRKLTLLRQTLPPGQMHDWLRTARAVVVAPSRYDTFNLVALEALLAGCPAVVSTACGVCDYLDAVYPGLPFIRIDPHDILARYAEIEDLLNHYDRHRDALRAYLASHAPLPGGGMALADIYGHAGSADCAARQQVDALFDLFQTQRIAPGIGRIEQELARNVFERFGAFFTGKQSNPFHGDYAVAQFQVACRISALAKQFHDGTALPVALANVEAALPDLCGMVHGGSRVPLYSLIAQWEQYRGNDLLYATYQLRIARLTGRFGQQQADAIAAILARHALHEEAQAVRLLARGDDDAIYAYLQARAGADYATPPVRFTQKTDLRGRSDVAVTIIVSVYNGADKVDAFVSGLERLTARSKAIADVIFIDSASQDASATALPQRLRQARQNGVRALYLRTPERETIQKAWNRGIGLARGGYLAFLGLDETIRPDALEIMADYLDANPEVDWVQGSAVVTEVDENGLYRRDVMGYDRSFDMQEVHYLDCCSISYVGALYRKSIHDRFGYYDTQFRGAGDTEFKNRVLPFIKVTSLPDTFGTFLNYPEARTTQSPLVELEDLRAWYLFRTPGGLRYGLERRGSHVASKLLLRSLNYKKSYMDRQCSDIELASALAHYLRRYLPAEYARIEQFTSGLANLRLACRRFDELVPLGSSEALPQVYAFAGSLERVWYWLDSAQRSHQFFGAAAEYWLNNDNRWHQHHTLWPSLARAS